MSNLRILTSRHLVSSLRNIHLLFIVDEYEVRERILKYTSGQPGCFAVGSVPSNILLSQALRMFQGRNFTMKRNKQRAEKGKKAVCEPLTSYHRSRSQVAIPVTDERKDQGSNLGIPSLFSDFFHIWG